LKRKAESGKRKAESGKRKAESGKRKDESEMAVIDGSSLRMKHKAIGRKTMDQ